jgi:hypothetical protein
MVREQAYMPVFGLTSRGRGPVSITNFLLNVRLLDIVAFPLMAACEFLVLNKTEVRRWTTPTWLQHELPARNVEQSLKLTFV